MQYASPRTKGLVGADVTWKCLVEYMQRNRRAKGGFNPRFLDSTRSFIVASAFFILPVWTSVTVSVNFSRDFVRHRYTEPSPSACSSHLSVRVNVLLLGSSRFAALCIYKSEMSACKSAAFENTEDVSCKDHEEDVNCLILHALILVFFCFSVCVCLCFFWITSGKEADERSCWTEGSHRALPRPATGSKFTTGHYCAEVPVECQCLYYNIWLRDHHNNFISGFIPLLSYFDTVVFSNFYQW